MSTLFVFTGQIGHIFGENTFGVYIRYTTSLSSQKILNFVQFFNNMHGL